MPAKPGYMLNDVTTLFGFYGVSGPTLGQPYVLRLFGIPTTQNWAYRGHWNIVLKPIGWLLRPAGFRVRLRRAPKKLPPGVVPGVGY